MSDIQNGNVNTFTPVEANSPEVDPVVAAFQAGSLIVYPTEAVMGIGCDPDNEAAVNALLEIKQRPVEKRRDLDCCELQSATALCKRQCHSPR